MIVFYFLEEDEREDEDKQVMKEKKKGINETLSGQLIANLCQAWKVILDSVLREKEVDN